MKKILFLFCCVAMFSCVKTNFSEFDNFSNLTKEMLAKSDFISLNQAYQMLSTSEEEKLWNAKFEAILKNDKDKITAEQYADVQFVYDFIKSKGYQKIKDDPTVGEVFLDENISKFESHFSKVQLYMLLECSYFTEGFSITKAQEYADKLAFNTGKYPNVNNCECRYNLGCPGWGNDCEYGKGNCNKVAECGLLGHSTCKGRCSLSPA